MRKVLAMFLGDPDAPRSTESFVREEVEEHLQTFLLDHQLEFVIGYSDSGDLPTHHAIFRNKDLLLSFSFDAYNGREIRAAAPCDAVIDPNTYRRMQKLVPIGFTDPGFYDGLVAAKKQLEYPDDVSIGEYYRFIDDALRKFVSKFRNGVIRLCPLERT